MLCPPAGGRNGKPSSSWHKKRADRLQRSTRGKNKESAPDYSSEAGFSAAAFFAAFFAGAFFATFLAAFFAVFLAAFFAVFLAAFFAGALSDFFFAMPPSLACSALRFRYFFRRLRFVTFLCCCPMVLVARGLKPPPPPSKGNLAPFRDSVFPPDAPAQPGSPRGNPPPAHLLSRNTSPRDVSSRPCPVSS